MRVLWAMSVVVLIGLAGAYIFAYKLSARRFYLFVALAWFTNAAYITLEAQVFGWSPSRWLVALSGLPTTFFLILAVGDLLEKRRLLYSTLAVFAVALAAAIGMAVYSLGHFASDQRRDVYALAPQILLAAGVLLYLGADILSWSDHAQLATLRPLELTSQGPYQIRRSIDVATTNDVRRALRQGRVILGGTFLVYGVIQPLYFLRIYERAAQWMLAAFWIAFTAKALNGIGLMLTLLGGFRHSYEMVRIKSLAEELGALTASIEHDIRNPAANIAKKLEVLRAQYQHEGGLVNGLRFINTQMERIRAAADVIPAMRESEEYYQRRFRTWNVHDIVRTSVKSVTSLSPAGAPEFDLIHPSAPIMIRGYRERLIQALVNILNNSVEAIANSQNRGRGKIQISTTRNSHHCEIEVRDNGSGIPKDLIDQVGSPMFSTKTDPDSSKSNRGVGVFITSRIVQQHNGHLRISSDSTSYTSVVIRLPVLEEEA